MITLVECPDCSNLHRTEYQGDCRNDAERYPTVEDFVARTGIPEFNLAGQLQIEQIPADEERRRIRARERGAM